MVVEHLRRSDYAGVCDTGSYGIYCVSGCSNKLHTYSLVSVYTSTRIDISIHTLSCQIFIFVHAHLHMFDYCPPLFVEHFQGQKAELIGYALGFWPSPTELGRNWHSATNHSPTHLEWDLRKVLNPQGRDTYCFVFCLF